MILKRLLVLAAKLCVRPHINPQLLAFSSPLSSLSSRSMNKAVTQSDQELVEFLREEIKLEKEQQLHPVLPRVKGFSTELNGCEVTLSRDYNGEAIIVKVRVLTMCEN